MRYKEFIKLQSENCENDSLRVIYEKLWCKFAPVSTYSNNINVRYTNDNVDDSIVKDKVIYIINTTSYRQKDENWLLNGYISKLNDDIVADNGFEYMFMGKSGNYNFYFRNGQYFVRPNCSNVLSAIGEDNIAIYEEHLVNIAKSLAF